MPRLLMASPFSNLFSANHVYEFKSKQELILFYHNTCFKPSKRILINAIKRNEFILWPGLISNLVFKYLSKTGATVKIHIKKYSNDQTLYNLIHFRPKQHLNLSLKDHIMYS